MDYDRVNDVLRRVNQGFETAELADLQSYEMETEDGASGEMVSAQGIAPTNEDFDTIEEAAKFPGGIVMRSDAELLKMSPKAIAKEYRAADMAHRKVAMSDPAGNKARATYIKRLKAAWQASKEEKRAVREDFDTIEEAYIGTGGTIPPDYTPDGDPVRGGDLGVDNLASDAEAYMSFVADTALDLSARAGVSEDDAMKAVEVAARELSDEGTLPPMPNIEDATSEELASWMGKASTCDLGARAREVVQGNTLHVVA